jgi:hypothetical protein
MAQKYAIGYPFLSHIIIFLPHFFVKIWQLFHHLEDQLEQNNITGGNVAVMPMGKLLVGGLSF